MIDLLGCCVENNGYYLEGRAEEERVEQEEELRGSYKESGEILGGSVVHTHQEL